MARVLSFNEAHAYLDGLADGLPEAITKELNGGILLLPDTVPSQNEEGLYTLGMYHYDPLGLGRYITLYYGSFRLVYGHETPQRQHDALREVLYHELTHHLESMAGVRDLEAKDEQFLKNYRRNKHKTENGD